jgi:hypothetical protein
VPDAALITARGWQLLNTLPPALRDSDDYRAVMHAHARESERLEAAIELVRDQFFPARTTVLLGAYERTLGLPVAPAGATEEDRRRAILATLAGAAAGGEGRAWVAAVTALIGPGWTYEEHIPGDGTSPPNYTLRIALPFLSSSDRWGQAIRLIRAITAAAWDIQFSSLTGFAADSSASDGDLLGS